MSLPPSPTIPDVVTKYPRKNKILCSSAKKAVQLINAKDPNSIHGTFFF